MIRGWCKVAIAAAQKLCGIRYRVLGLNNLPTGPAILLSKHQSAWETLALPVIMPKPLCFVLKKELLSIPFFGWVLGLTHMISIDRKQGNKAFLSVISQGERRLQDGSWIIMFPEGTRTPVGKCGRYKVGGARLAIATQSPIIPIAHNAGHCWSKGKFSLTPGEITISIGSPIFPNNQDVNALNQSVADWIELEMHIIDSQAY